MQAGLERKLNMKGYSKKYANAKAKRIVEKTENSVFVFTVSEKCQYYSPRLYYVQEIGHGKSFNLAGKHDVSRFELSDNAITKR